MWLKWFWGESQWVLVICEPFWNYSGANLNDSWTILGWILANLSCLWTILKWFCSKSWRFANHAEMIPGQISVIHEPFWNDSRANLRDLQTILKWFMYPQKSSWILTNHTWWKRGRVNLPEYVRFMRMHEDSIVNHIELHGWIADSINIWLTIYLLPNLQALWDFFSVLIRT